MRNTLAVITFVALTMGCAHEPLPVTGAESPLMFDTVEIEASQAIAVFVPGALSSIEIFSPANAWKASGYALVYYRFPGLDGLSLDHELAIENAATEIAQFADRYPQKPIRLLGYSTGGPIAILASQLIQADDVRVAALSPAPTKAGGFRTFLRSSRDILTASFRARSVKRNAVWREYYRTLLFGRVGLNNPYLTNRIDEIVERQIENIVYPEPALTRAHTRDIRNWTVPEAFRVDPTTVSFYVGTEDPVFSTEQTRQFAELLGITAINEYPAGGHLLFLTHPEVFADVLSFFERQE